MGVEILGRMYEDILGTTIKVIDGGSSCIVEPKRATIKAGGIIILRNLLRTDGA